MKKHSNKEQWAQLLDWVKDQKHLVDVTPTNAKKHTLVFTIKHGYVSIKVTMNAISQKHKAWTGFQSRNYFSFDNAKKYLSKEYFEASEQRCGGLEHRKQMKKLIHRQKRLEEIGAEHATSEKTC